MAKKTQAPVFEQVIEAYEAALVLDENIPADASKRLINLLKDDVAPNEKKIAAALFPLPKTEDEA